MQTAATAISVMQCTDTFGSVVVFEQKNYDKHKKKHPVLNSRSFCPNKITKTLQNPTLTIASKNPDTLCYYLEYFNSNGIIRYTKVVVYERFRNRVKDPICTIKTAFNVDHIQELKYGLQATYH